jgi:hypothetical protein
MTKKLVTDDDIADYLRYVCKHLRYATEQLVKKGQPNDCAAIFTAHFAFNELTNDLEEYIEALKLNGNVYKSRRNYQRMLRMEQEYRDDDEYFRLQRGRAGVETKPIP